MHPFSSSQRPKWRPSGASMVDISHRYTPLPFIDLFLPRLLAERERVGLDARSKPQPR